MSGITSPEWEATKQRRKQFDTAVTDAFDYVRKAQDLGNETFYAQMIEAARTKDPSAVNAVRDEAISWLTAEKAKRELLNS